MNGPGFGDFKQGAVSKVDKAAPKLFHGITPGLRAKLIKFDLLKCPSTDPEHPWISKEIQHFGYVIDAHIEESTAGRNVALDKAGFAIAIHVRPPASPMPGRTSVIRIADCTAIDESFGSTGFIRVDER